MKNCPPELRPLQEPRIEQVNPILGGIIFDNALKKYTFHCGVQEVVAFLRRRRLGASDGSVIVVLEGIISWS